MSSSTQGKRTSWRDLIVPGIFGVIIALIAAAVAVFINFHNSPNVTSPPSTPATSSSSSTVTPAVSPSVSGSLGCGQSPTEAAQVEYLADIKPVSGDPGTGPSTIGGNKVRCLKSVRFPINGFNSTYTAVYNIGPTLTTFHATLGIDNGTKDGAKVHFQIYVDDASVDTGYMLDFLSTKEIEINVTGKSRLKLVTEAVDAGGVGNTGHATWGDARFTN